MDNFLNSLKSQLPEAASLENERIIPLGTSAGEILFILPENDPETVIARATVGSLEGVKERGEFMKSALNANLFWGATNGATLSIGEEDTLVLSRHYEDAQFEVETALGDEVEAFAAALDTWKKRLELAGGKLV